MLKKIKFWLEISRAYSLPMSIMSFFVPFIFAVIDGGNIFYGFIALIGVVSAHAGVNMFDDFSDYLLAQRAVKKGACFDDIFQKNKCRFLLDGSLTLLQLFAAISVCFTLAFLCGLYLAFHTGVIVFYIMFAAFILGLLYPFLTFIALGEITVGIMFAPLLYIGVYYVMTKSFSQELIPLAISTGLLTIGLLHAHMFLDFDFDKKNKKTTLCSLAKNKKNTVCTQVLIMAGAYLNIIFQCFNGLSKIYLISLFSLPTAIVLYKLMRDEADGLERKICTNIFFGILENMQQYQAAGNSDFMIKFMVARNIMVEFSILICIAKIITELS